MIDLSIYYPSLTAPYKSWGDKKLITGSQYIFTCMDGNAYFTGIAADVTVYGELSANFAGKVALAGNRDKNAVIAKDLVRVELIGNTLNLANSVSKIANGDIQILGACGMPMRKRVQPIVLTAPTNLVVTPGKVPGQLTISVNRVKGARSYVVKYSLDPQTPDSSWASVTCTKRDCTLTGLQSGSKYWIMVGAVGGNDQTLWSVAQLSSYVP